MEPFLIVQDYLRALVEASAARRVQKASWHRARARRLYAAMTEVTRTQADDVAAARGLTPAPRVR